MSNPFLEQYRTLKEEAGDGLLLYRMGDFLESFFEDARVVSDVLNLALTERIRAGDGVSMCGFAFHSADGHVSKLVRAGHSIAIAEQTETVATARDARGPGALPSRAIVRVISANQATREVE